MADNRTVHLRGPTQRAHAKQLIDQAPPGYVMRLAKETRSDAQNRKLWPLIAELQQQVPGFEVFSGEDIKNRLMNALGTEMRFLPTLEGQGQFPVGFRSSKLTVEQFGALIELIYEFGARHGVRFREP